MKKYVLVIVLGFAILFPALAGAISLDRSNYAIDQTIVIPNALGHGYRFYNLTVPDFVVTINGLSEAYELPADFLIPGDYIVVDTNNPDVCGAISLDECRANPDYIGETAFFVNTSPLAIDIIDSGATPLAPLPDTAPVDSTSTPETDSTSSPQAMPAPVIQDNGDGSVTLIAI